MVRVSSVAEFASINRRTIGSTVLAETLLASIREPARIADFMRLVGTSLSARSGALVVSDGERFRHIDFFPTAPGVTSRYLDNLWAHDPYRHALSTLPPMRSYQRNTVLDYSKVEAHRDYIEWLREIDVRDAIMARLPLEQGYEGRICLMRAYREPEFTPADTAVLDSVLQPLAQVLELWNRFDIAAIAADVSNRHLDQIGHGVLALDAEGRTQYMNPVATTLLADNREALTLAAGKLLLRDAVAHARYCELLRQCSLSAGSRFLRSGGALSAGRPGRMPLGITVYPCKRPEQGKNIIMRNTRALVTVFDPQRLHTDSRETLREMFDLSNAEAELCWQLANGSNLREIAETQGASSETLRSRLKRVFAKTGTNRQADIIRLVISGPARGD